MSRSEYAIEYRRHRRAVEMGWGDVETSRRWLAEHVPPRELYEQVQREAEAERRRRQAEESREIREAMREIDDQRAQERWLAEREREESAHESARDLAERMASSQREERRLAWIGVFRERHPLGARELLAIERERRECLRTMSRGGQYYECHLATRAVVIEAVAILRERARRRSCRGIAEAARKGRPGRILIEAKRRRAERQARELEVWRERVAAARLALGRVRREFRDSDLLRERVLNRVDAVADGAVRLAVRAVGPIGEQAEADLEAMRTAEEFSGKRGRHHRLDRTTVERIEALADWAAALITLRDHVSFGRRGFDGYESRGGSSYRSYLVVRDSTTGEAHILRVAPKFGNADTRFWGEITDLDHSQWRGASPALLRRMRRATPTARRIHAAVASTFGLRAGQYDPGREA